MTKMAEEEKTIGEDFAESTATQVGIIGSNMADTAGEAGALLKEGILKKLSGGDSPQNEVSDPPPPPDVTAPEPPAQAHEILKEAAAQTVPHSPEGATTLHDQLEQAKEQMAQLGK